MWLKWLPNVYKLKKSKVPSENLFDTCWFSDPLCEKNSKLVQILIFHLKMYVFSVLVRDRRTIVVVVVVVVVPALVRVRYHRASGLNKPTSCEVEDCLTQIAWFCTLCLYILLPSWNKIYAPKPCVFSLHQYSATKIHWSQVRRKKMGPRPSLSPTPAPPR